MTFICFISTQAAKILLSSVPNNTYEYIMFSSFPLVRSTILSLQGVLGVMSLQQSLNQPTRPVGPADVEKQGKLTDMLVGFY